MDANKKARVEDDERFRQEAAAMNQKLMLSVVRQHELMEALSASELRYRRFFESANDGILLLDADKGTVYDANPSIIKMLGYSHEEMTGKRLWDIVPAKNVKTAKVAFKDLLQKEAGRYDNLSLEASDGRIIEVEVISSVYEIDRTRVIQCNFRDISERKALEKQKAEFYAMVTHDIRSPLTVISGYSDILKSKADKLDAETNQAVTSIINSGLNIESLIENFLSISKAETGKLVVNAAPTNMAELLQEAGSTIEQSVRLKDIDFKIEAAGDLPKAMVDPNLTERAVMNLLQNAVNYTPRRENHP